jgi:beta-lactamase regulating signal transducer with metallopeptidase domain
MTFLLDSVLKTSALLSIALLAVAFLRRQSAAILHRVLAAGIFCAALAPIATLAVTPLVQVEIPHWMNVTVVGTNVHPSSEVASESHVNGESSESANTPGAFKPFSEMDLNKFFQWLWLAGAIAGIAVLVTGSVRLARMASDSEQITDGPWARLTAAVSQEYGLRGSVRLLRGRNSAILASWGVFFPKILLPANSEDWPEERIRAVLCHELAHIRRRDWFVQIVTEVLRVIYWFNPLFWIACGRLRLESEYACDNAVLEHGFLDSHYAAHLLDVVRTVNRTDVAWSALTMAQESTIQKRFKAILNPDLQRGSVTRFAMLAILLAATGITLSVCSLSQTPQSKIIPGTITGIVVNAAGEKISGALVNASTSADKTWTVPLVAKTNAEGVFQLAGLDAGSYGLQVRAAGFFPSRMAVVQLQPNQGAKVELTTDLVQQEPSQETAAVVPLIMFKGSTVSIDVENRDIQEFFSRIAQASGTEIGLDPSVGGAITAHIRSVPWDEAFNLVVRASWLSSYYKTNKLRVTGKIPSSLKPGSPKVIIEGRVARFQMQNPQSLLQVEAPDASGKIRLWPVEWSSANELTQLGLNDSILRPGDHVIIAGDLVDSDSKIHLLYINRPIDGFSWGGGVTWSRKDSANSDAMMFVVAHAK